MLRMPMSSIHNCKSNYFLTINNNKFKKTKIESASPPLLAAFTPGTGTLAGKQRPVSVGLPVQCQRIGARGRWHAPKGDMTAR